MASLAFTGTVQFRTDRVVANHRLHTLACERTVGRPCRAIDVTPGFEKCSADIASNLAGGVEDQHFVSGHTRFLCAA